LPLCDAVGSQFISDLFPSATGRVVAVWRDDRNGSSDIYAQCLEGDAPVPVTVSLVDVITRPGFTRIEWYVEGGLADPADVQRQSPSGAWEARTTVLPDASGRIVHEDRIAEPGRYGYRLQFHDQGAVFHAGETWVDVLGARGLSIDAPNPVDRDLAISVTLPGAEAARLDLLDVSGRRIDRHQWSAGSIGTWSVDFSASAARMLPGVYFLRLSQGARSVVTRLSVVH
jgi:hypothetical protein